MKDSYGRTIDYMRISITDRCNLRCKYCMPYGVDCVEPRNILTFEEIWAIAICGAGLGIRHVKVTGGEPLVRKDCCQLIQMLKSIPGIEKVTLTTNGVLLERYLEPLLKAGVDGINISLDTRNRNMYEEITGSDCLEAVLRGIRLASESGIPVKVNAVSIDFEEGPGCSWKSVAELAREYPVDVRFIEMMPIGYGRNFKTINHQVLLEEMEKEYPGLCRDDRPHGFGPAVYYQIPGFQGSIGLISAIHGKFCENCNRVRLTSQGYLKTCLCFEDGVNLREVLREGQAESETGSGHWKWRYQSCPGETMLQERLAEAMSQAILRKPAAHCFETPGRITEMRNMVDIGG
ncbi:MAG: GTP 3',8-cyclase MoaA [Lachnospiraceae bacterium]|nr:GTP 3',8-cyclase MoaA [Lachnospiraceae bacterium]